MKRYQAGNPKEQSIESNGRRVAMETEKEETQQELDQDEIEEANRLVAEDAETQQKEEEERTQFYKQNTLENWMKRRLALIDLEAAKVNDFIAFIDQLPYVKKSFKDQLCSTVSETTGPPLKEDFLTALGTNGSERSHLHQDQHGPLIDLEWIDSASLEELLPHLNKFNKELIGECTGSVALKVARSLLRADAEKLREKLRADAEKQRADAEKQRADAEKLREKQRADASYQVQELRRKLHHVIEGIVQTLSKVVTTLQHASGMSQAEETTGTSVGTKTRELHMVRDIGYVDTDVAGGCPELKQLLEESIKEYSPFPTLASDKQSPRDEQLLSLSKNWEDFIMKTTMKEEPQKTSKSQANCKTLSVEDVQLVVRTWLNSKKGCDGDKNRDFQFPGIQSEEVHCVQPIFMALLQSIGECLTEMPKQPFSPAKTRIKKSQIIPATTSRPQRVADICIDKPGRFMYLMYDHTIKLLMEVKAVKRATKSWGSAQKEALRQSVSHMAKYLYKCLNFYGVGASSFAHGITGTLAYIAVHKLELTMQEVDQTPSDPEIAILRLYEGKKYPLMTEKCFEKWMNGAEGLEELKNELYPPENAGVDKKGIPLGMRLLLELMDARRSSLFGPDYGEILGTSTRFTQIGSGSFSIIFEDNANKNTVIKIPTMCIQRHINREALVLKSLERHQTTVDRVGVVVLKMEITQALHLGGIQVHTKALQLEPKGTPIVPYIRENDSLDLSKVSQQLESALQYIHKKNVVHCDVTPKNIVVATNGDDHETPFRAVLVDFGCAVCETDGARHHIGFTGTPDYAITSVFKQYPSKKWIPVQGQDYVGLGLTLSALITKGKPSWNMSPFPCNLIDKSTAEGKPNGEESEGEEPKGEEPKGELSIERELQESVTHRTIKAIQAIESYGCDPSIKERWIQWIKQDEKLNVKRPNQTTASGNIQKRSCSQDSQYSVAT